MGRPREHDERTAAALLDAAERTIQQQGVESLSVRHLADDVGTTTRAVYSLFGSKDGLLAALGARAFDLLRSALQDLPVTSDPGGDLVDAACTVFRRFATTHPTLFHVGFKRDLVAPELAAQFEAARLSALAALEGRMSRLKQAGQLGDRPVNDALSHFHALCEGLADMELRGALPAGREDEIWRDAVSVLVAGFSAPRPKRRRSGPLTVPGTTVSVHRRT
ncbi:MAG TPA: TetR/AcrR family transcriptional regulator [Acidimicrobiales bacterium]|nr:TetR/AcrR family transcriptional regulator [Acidimicrobiales bacterium]